MKPVLIAFALISCGISSADQENPKQIRVSLQFIEVAHPVLTEMLAAGQPMHDKAFALAKEGKARILETCMVMCRSGRKATLESIREEIFPTEYTSPQLPCGNPSNVRLASDPPTNPLFRSPTAFDTRNTGVTFKVESTVSSNGTIDLHLSPDIVTPLRLETWMEHVDRWGDASIRMPIYESWRLNTSINVESGKFELVSAISPKSNAPVPAVMRKILVFIRADILPVPASP